MGLPGQAIDHRATRQSYQEKGIRGEVFDEALSHQHQQAEAHAQEHGEEERTLGDPRHHPLAPVGERLIRKVGATGECQYHAHQPEGNGNTGAGDQLRSIETCPLIAHHNWPIQNHGGVRSCSGTPLINTEHVPPDHLKYGALDVLGEVGVEDHTERNPEQRPDQSTPRDTSLAQEGGRQVGEDDRQQHRVGVIPPDVDEA